MEISHLVSFHPIKLYYQFRNVMASRNSVYYSCCKVLNLLNFLQVCTSSTGIYNVTIAYFRYNCGVDNSLRCFFARGFSFFRVFNESTCPGSFYVC